MIGIDFGTSNTAVATPSGEVLRIDHGGALFRTVLFFPEDSGETLAGSEAIERYQDDNAGRFIQSMKTWLPAQSFSRTQLRNRTLSLEELIAIFLRKVGEAVKAQGHTTDAVVLGRPARFSTDPADARLLELLDPSRSDLAGDAQLHAEALDLLRKHPAMGQAQAYVVARAQEAKELLRALPEGSVRTALEAFADVVAVRSA